MNIKFLSWHDGILGDISFEPNYKSGSKVTIYLSLYPEQSHSSVRNPLKITCTDVAWFKHNVNVNDLEENASAGNINLGELLGPVLRIELFGGDILVKAAAFRVDKC